MRAVRGSTIPAWGRGAVGPCVALLEFGGGLALTGGSAWSVDARLATREASSVGAPAAVAPVRSRRAA
jgi:hypothetical protein